MNGLKKSITKVSKAAKHSSTVASAQKGKMSHPAGKSGNKMGPQMSSTSTVKTSHKAANKKTLFQRIAHKPMFND